MPGAPLDPYLADVWAAFAPGAQLAGYGPPSATPVTSGTPLPAVAPPPNTTGYPSIADVPPPTPNPAPAPPPPPIGPPPAPPDAGMSLPTDDPNALVSKAPPNMSVPPPAPPQVGVEAGPPPPGPPQPGPDPHAWDLQSTAGGGVPAHEVETRGPSVLKAQDQRNQVYTDTIDTVASRNQSVADDELQMALSQERSARLREAAYQQSIAEQEDELQARQEDFDTTTRQMGRLGHIDPGRFWASRSTGQKIAGALEVMLSGFNRAPSMIQKRIDDDIKAQEFAFYAAKDVASAKQTAFSAAMAKYQNANAARAAARVASLDVLQTQLAQIAAKNKGNETGNRALEALAQVQNDKMMQTMAGIRFVQAQAGGRYWIDPATGLIYNEAEAKARRAKQLEWQQADRTEGAKVGGQILVQRDKAALEAGPDGSPLTKEQRGKMEMERREKQTAVDAMNSQFTAMINNPVLERLSPISAARASLPGAPRHSAAAYDDKQELDTLNQQFLTTLGKVAKDNEGKPGVAMLKKFEEKFKISQGFDTKESAIKNIRDVQRIANDLYAQGGATPMSRELSPEAKASLGGYSK